MMMIRTNLAAFNAALVRYRALTGFTPKEIITKQGGKLAWVLSRRLRGLAPAKGEVREERLAALRRGEGILVRESAQQAVAQKRRARSDISTRQTIFGGGKGRRSLVCKGGGRMNLWALMVQRELNIRERAKGFLSASIRYPRVLIRSSVAKARYGQFLSRALLSAKKDALRFAWGPEESGLSAKAAGGLLRGESQRQIAAALADTTEDIMVYVRRKMAENARASGFRR